MSWLIMQTSYSTLVETRDAHTAHHQHLDLAYGAITAAVAIKTSHNAF